LPSSVESNVEQYLKKKCSAPAFLSASAAASDWATASVAGLVRDLSATTTASASERSTSRSGTPAVWMTFMPSRASINERSVAPVRSSAMHPSRIMVAPPQ